MNEHDVTMGRTYRVAYRPMPQVTTGRPRKDRVVIGVLTDLTVHKASGERMLHLRQRNGRSTGVWESLIVSVEEKAA